MKQYTVIALSVGGRGNKIFSSGDTVFENNFIPGRAEELVKQGFLKPVEAPAEPKPVVELTPDASAAIVEGTVAALEELTAAVQVETVSEETKEEAPAPEVKEEPAAGETGLLNEAKSSLNVTEAEAPKKKKNRK